MSYDVHAARAAYATFIDPDGPARMTVEEIAAHGMCRPHGHLTDEGAYIDDQRQLRFLNPCIEHHPHFGSPNENCGQPWCSTCGIGLVKQRITHYSKELS